MLSQLTMGGMAINIKKVKFLQEQLLFLGHRVVNGKLAPNPKKLGKLATFAAPTSTKAVQKLFGLLNYFRDYVPAFASITKPITRLLSAKEDADTWTTQEASIVHSICEYLTHNAILVIPDFSKGFTVATHVTFDSFTAALL